MIYDVEMDSHQPISQTCFCFFTSSTLWWCHSPPVRWGMRRNFHVWLKFTTGVQHSRWSISTILDAKHFESHVPIETVTGAINSLMMSWPKMMPSTGEKWWLHHWGNRAPSKDPFNQEPGMSSSPPSLSLKGDRFGLHCSHSWHLRTTKDRGKWRK